MNDQQQGLAGGAGDGGAPPAAAAPPAQDGDVGVAAPAIVAAGAPPGLRRFLSGRLGWRVANLAFALLCFLALAVALFLEYRLPEASGQPDGVDDELQKIINLQVSGRPVVAKRDLQEYLEGNPDNALAHNMMSGLLRHLGNHALALRHAKIAVALEPGNNGYVVNEYEIHNAMGRKGDAVQALERLLDAEPDNLSALMARARLLYDLGRHAESISDLEFALEQHPEDISLHLLHGKVMFSYDMFEEALASLRFVAANDDGNLRLEANGLIAQINKLL